MTASTDSVQKLIINDWLPEQLANGSHGHWSQRQQKLKAAQMAVWVAAKQVQLKPVTGRARVTINLVFPNNRRRDADGLHSRIKGVLDGLVRGKWIEDDSTTHIDLHVTAEVRSGQKQTEITLSQTTV